MSEELHLPVMLKEVLSYLLCNPKGIYLDATLGDGGHAEGICGFLEEGGCLIGIDWDDEALERARKRLSGCRAALHLIHGSYCDLETLLAGLGISKVDGILLDLGVSTRQLTEPSRGFSFHWDSDLDMRMDRRQAVTARDLVNKLSEDRLSEIIFRYGEERWARRIAALIVAARDRSGPIHRSSRLVEIIKAAVPAALRQRGKHPARRTFQALRIAVNDELKNIEAVLPQAVNSLKPGGRLCVIAYHSLEDRLVKHFFKERSQSCRCPAELPCLCAGEAELELPFSGAIKPANEELASNPRSRSARLRVAHKREF